MVECGLVPGYGLSLECQGSLLLGREIGFRVKLRPVHCLTRILLIQRKYTETILAGASAAMNPGIFLWFVKLHSGEPINAAFCHAGFGASGAVKQKNLQRPRQLPDRSRRRRSKSASLRQIRKIRLKQLQ